MTTVKWSSGQLVKWSRTLAGCPFDRAGHLTLQGSPTTIRDVPFTEKARAGASKIWPHLVDWPDAPGPFVLGRMIRRIP